jgi:hypothetical protein
MEEIITIFASTYTKKALALLKAFEIEMVIDLGDKAFFGSGDWSRIKNSVRHELLYNQRQLRKRVVDGEDVRNIVYCEILKKCEEFIFNDSQHQRKTANKALYNYVLKRTEKQ